MAGFQTQVNVNPAWGLPGDFADANPRWNIPAINGALVAGAGGVQAGRFAWIDPSGTYAVNRGGGAPAGFVHRELQGLILTYLAETSQLIPAGFEVSVFTGGSFWAANAGAGAVAIGMKAYANFADGSVTFGATGNAPVGASVTGAVAASTGSFTGSISNNVFIVTAVSAGVVVPGGTLAGGATIAGTQVVGQLTGVTGGIGTYQVNLQQNVASGTITETYGTLTITAVGSGNIAVGSSFAGAGVVAGTTVTAFGTGTGGNGTYIVNNNTVVASTALTVAGGIETKWIAMNPAGPGELVVMTTQQLG